MGKLFLICTKAGGVLKRSISLIRSEHPSNSSHGLHKVLHILKIRVSVGFFLLLLFDGETSLLFSQVSQSLSRILCPWWYLKGLWHDSPAPSLPVLLPPLPGSLTKAHCLSRQTGLCIFTATFSSIFSSLTLILLSRLPRLTVLLNGVLQIHNVRLEDAGKYRCVATNIGSRLKSREATLTVHKGKVIALTELPD